MVPLLCSGSNARSQPISSSYLHINITAFISQCGQCETGFRRAIASLKRSLLRAKAQVGRRRSGVSIKKQHQSMYEHQHQYRNGQTNATFTVHSLPAPLWTVHLFNASKLGTKSEPWRGNRHKMYNGLNQQETVAWCRIQQPSESGNSIFVNEFVILD